MTLRDRLLTFFASSLRGAQRGWHWLLAVLLALLVANTLFMLARRYGFGCALDAPDACQVSLYYQALVLLHSLLGLLLVLAVAGFVLAHVPRNLKLARRRPQMPLTGLLILVALVVLVWSGLHFLFNAKTADMAWLWNTHMAVAAGILLAYLGHRSLARPASAPRMLAGGLVATLTLALGLILVELVVAPERVEPSPPPALAATDGYIAPAQVSPQSPFFPSPVRLASGAAAMPVEPLLARSPIGGDAGAEAGAETGGDAGADAGADAGGEAGTDATVRAEVAARGFASTVPIGAENCVRCHADTVAQWAASAHRFSSFNNPFYAASIDALRAEQQAPNAFIARHLTAYDLPAAASGIARAQFCAGCHDPLLLLTGRWRDDIDRGSVAAQAGLTCMSCHGIVDIPSHTGNGNYVWNDAFSNSYLFAGATGGVARWLHDTYLKANPERHKADLQRPLHQTPEFCATCHKVSLDRPVNDYRWVRGQNEYDAWHASGVAHNAARTFYLPGSVRACRDCHMPLVPVEQGDLAADNGLIRSHRFAAANTALPWLRGDRRMLAETESMLRDKALRLFIGGVGAADGTVVPLADGAPRPIEAVADTLELHVVVRNLNVGHTFPGGTNDSNEAWLEVTASGPAARFTAGALDAAGHVTPNTRIYHAVLVDREGRRIDRRNAQDIVAPVYVAVIPPGTADLARYAIPLAELGELGAGSTIRVRLLWRKFNRTFTEYAWSTNRAGFAEFIEPPELPITEIAATNLRVARESADGPLLVSAEPPPGVEAPALLHDYAIGFLRQGDLRAARQVVADLLARTPDCVNCLRTRARIEIAEGAFAAARRTLLAAEALAPADPQTAWLWAGLLFQEGNLDAAGSALERVLAAFPKDREALKLKAQVAYRDGRYADAVAAVGQALAIDPEDATAHYYAMLAQRALGDAEAARLAEAAYRYHKADEGAQQATLAFRRAEDAANFAAQQIKVFALK